MKRVSQTTQFSRDVKRMRKRGKDLGELQGVVRLLAAGMTLPPKHRDHQLKGVFRDCRECHIEADWLLIYRIEGNVLQLVRTGTHSDLFR